MSASIEIYEEMKRFLEFGAEDAANLKALGPVIGKHGKAITEAFYDTLGKFTATAKMIEGRVDLLKATHGVWMGQLFEGEYGEAYFNRRLLIGKRHVQIGLDPYYVEAVMSVIRTKALDAMGQEIKDAADLSKKFKSLLKILDLDLLVVNLAYSEERLDRMAECTGMSRALIENLIKQAV